MKKIISISFTLLITIFLLIAAVPANIFAADVGMTLTVASQTGRPGDTVKVAIDLSNNPGISSLKFNVTYDSMLALTNVEFGSDFGSYITTPEPYTNPLPITMISPLAEATANGAVATLTFTIDENAPDNYSADIKIDFDAEDIFDENYDAVELTTVNGSVTVQHGIPGDINGDSKVNTKDAILLFRYIAGWSVDVNTSAIDVNCDNKVNTKDAITLFRYISGWNVEIGYPGHPVGLSYVSNGDGTCCVNGIGMCTDIDVVIPEKSPAGDKVTSIGTKAFYNCTSIKSITIPSTVTSIGSGAFEGCLNIERINIGSLDA